MTWLRSLVESRATDWYYATLRREDEVQPDSAYLNVHLRSLRLANVRKGLKRFSSAVHSSIRFHHLGGPASVHTFTLPDELRELDPSHLDRVVQSSQRLLGPVPYRGGDVSIDIALLSIETDDLLDAFAGTIADLTSAVGVQYVSAALPFVKPIENAVHRLVGVSGQNVLEIGLSRDFEAPAPGLYLVMQAPRQELRDVRLIYDDEYRVSREDGRALDYAYLTFEIVATQHRDAWFAIPDLNEAHTALNVVTRAGNVKAAKDQFAAFRYVTLSSLDLLLDDAVCIVNKVECELEAKLKATATGAGTGTGTELTPLEELDPFS